MIKTINGIQYDSDAAEMIMYSSYHRKYDNYWHLVIQYCNRSRYRNECFELDQLIQYGREDTKHSTMYNPFDIKEVSREIKPKTEDEVLEVLLDEQRDYDGIGGFYGTFTVASPGFSKFLKITDAIQRSFIQKWLELGSLPSLHTWGVKMLQEILLQFIDDNYDEEWIFSKEALERYSLKSVECSIGYQDFLEEMKDLNEDTKESEDTKDSEDTQPF